MSNYEFVKNIFVSSEDRVTIRLKFPMHDKEERGQVSPNPPHKNIAVGFNHRNILPKSNSLPTANSTQAFINGKAPTDKHYFIAFVRTDQVQIISFNCYSTKIHNPLSNKIRMHVYHFTWPWPMVHLTFV